MKYIIETEAEYDGTMIYEDTVLFGYWFYNETQTGGHWVNEESTDSGYWEQDYDSETIGTWRNMNYTQYGFWSQDSEDSTIIHIVHYCEDTNDGETDSYGTGCSGYEYEWCSSTDYNTDTFNAQEMCCVCGGGAHYDDTSDDTVGEYGGTIVNSEGETKGYWYLNDTSDGGEWTNSDNTD